MGSVQTTAASFEQLVNQVTDGAVGLNAAVPPTEPEVDVNEVDEASEEAAEEADEPTEEEA